MMWQAEVIRSHLADILAPIAANEEIEPAVVIIVEKPGGEAVAGFGDACVGGDISEDPVGRQCLLGRWRAIVSQKNVWFAQPAYIKIGTSIVVVVAAGDTFHPAHNGDAACLSALGESSVAVVLEEFTHI